MAIPLSSILPAPTQHVYDKEEEDKNKKLNHALQLIHNSTAPPYGHRKGWIPRKPEDYGDGGAFPEIPVAQFPLGMGQEKPGVGKNDKQLAVQVDAQGNIKYDAIARYGHSKDKIVHSKFTDLVPKAIQDDDPELEKPDDDAIRENTERTRRALEKLVSGKIAAALPVRHAEKTAPAQYIRYTPSQQGVAYNSGAKQRIIRMVEVQKDPISPPRFKTNKKIPRGPPSPPAPVMHSPNRKVSVKEQQEWKIPPCISNWKNARGYTIPLDKRLAADGRGLQGVHINENFSKLAEALYIADRKAREAVETRAQMEQKIAAKEKEKKEENLRALAQRAREERAGMRRAADDRDEDARARDDFRRDRKHERARDRNIERAAPDKRNRLRREQERDISEKIALGMPNPGTSSETQYDQRLFNQSSGMDSGFADDEAYTVYDKPWRKDRELANNVYRPSKNVDKEAYGDDFDTIMKSNRFVPDRGFEGTDRSSKRDGPVQFEKDEEEDPFGLNKFLDEAKRTQKRGPEEERRKGDHKKRRDH